MFEGLPVELFELILILLPTKDLLLAQAVSKLWRETIARSFRLQQALFMKPEDPTECVRYTIADVVHDDGRQNWLNETWSVVSARASDHFGIHDGKIRMGNVVLHEMRKPIGRINDLILTVERFDSLYHDVAQECSGTFFRFLNGSTLNSEDNTHASWRHMYLCQPPALVVDYAWIFRASQTDLEPRRRRQPLGMIDVEREGTIENPEGVTVGQLVDRIRELEKETGGYFTRRAPYAKHQAYGCLCEGDEDDGNNSCAGWAEYAKTYSDMQVFSILCLSLEQQQVLKNYENDKFSPAGAACGYCYKKHDSERESHILDRPIHP